MSINPLDWFNGRDAVRGQFLARVGWADADISPVGEDCAFRRYFRLRRADGQSRILMEGVPDGSPIATPGHNMKDFMRIGAYLRGLGLRAPNVFDADEGEGYLLLEDFGDVSFKRAMGDGVAARDDLYALATDILSHLRRNARDGGIILPDYYASHVHTGRRRMVDWYMPAVLGRKNPDGLVDDYLTVWDGIEKNLPPVPRGFLHIDYHFENLMRLPGATGMDRCGLLDFQGAMTGPAPYDLANLLEDARVDIPADLRAAMLDRYCRDMGADEREIFRAWYRVLATQFHCRVLGQFIRLAVRDGKRRYLDHLPRVAGYIRAGLDDPILAPLGAWSRAHGLDFTVIPAVNTATAALIRSDAF